MIAGVQKHLANGQLTFAGGTFTETQIVGELQQLDLRNTARAATQVQVDAEAAKRPALVAFMDALVECLRVAFGTQADVMADLGVEPRKPRTPLTVEQKAAAAAKREATREARGTKSAKAKKGIRGAVTGVVVTPIVAGAPSSRRPPPPPPLRSPEPRRAGRRRTRPRPP